MKGRDFRRDFISKKIRSHWIFNRIFEKKKKEKLSKGISKRIFEETYVVKRFSMGFFFILFEEYSIVKG